MRDILKRSDFRYVCERCRKPVRGRHRCKKDRK